MMIVSDPQFLVTSSDMPDRKPFQTGDSRVTWCIINTMKVGICDIVMEHKTGTCSEVPSGTSVHKKIAFCPSAGRASEPLFFRRKS